MASTSHAVAQELTVQIPFAFQNGSQHLPAGRYDISFESGHMLMLRGATTGGAAITNPTESRKVADTGKVVFRRYGDRYFIREVWVAGSKTGYQCVKTRAEKQVQIARNDVAPSNVELALNHSPW